MFENFCVASAILNYAATYNSSQKEALSVYTWASNT